MASTVAAEDGVQVKGSIKEKTIEFSASDESVKRVTLALERMWNSGLAWSEHNPWLFVAVLICVTIVAVTVCLRWGRSRSQRIEYDHARGNSKRQLPLDLPSPKARDRGV